MVLRKISRPIRFFRWFKLTLKPSIAVARNNLRLAICDTSFWTFFAQIWTQYTLRHMSGPIMAIFDICQFLMAQGPFEYFSEMGVFRKSKISR